MGGGLKQATLFDFGSLPRQEAIRGVSGTNVKPPHSLVVSCPVCQMDMGKLTMENRIRHVEECLSVAAIRKNRIGSCLEDTAISGPCVDHGSSKPAHLPEVEPVVKAEVILATEAKEASENEIIVLSPLPGPEEKQEIVINERKNRNPPVKNHPNKRKCELGPSQKERLRYVNSQPSTKRKKASTKVDSTTNPSAAAPIEDSENAPPALLPSSRKLEIPDLKIMKFPISKDKAYQVSVDAFCYKPLEHICQYFLLHFHSDHYGGITKKWCRERTIDSKIIYCSVITGRLLQIRYSVEPCHLFAMENDVRYKIRTFKKVESFENGGCESFENGGCEPLENGGHVSQDNSPGLYVTCIDANHCPGAVIFLFECISLDHKLRFSLHCGDFRVSKEMMQHPVLKPFLIGAGHHLDSVYLDTTYMTPKYNFPKQDQVCSSVATLIHEFIHNDDTVKGVFGRSMQSRITDFLKSATATKSHRQKKYLVLVGTYLIGKEKLAVLVLKRLGNAPIYVSNVNSRGDKEHIVRSYQDTYLDSVLTSDAVANSDHDVMIHLVPMKIAGNIQELYKYFNHNSYHEHFERCIGLRPTGWSFKNNDEETSSGVASDMASEVPYEVPSEVVEIDEAQISIQSTAELLRKQPKYDHLDVLLQNLNKRNGKIDPTTYRIYSVPYSEHSSFRELSFFVIFVNIKHVIPTVNTSNPYSAQAMAEIIRRWESMRGMLTGQALSLPNQIVSSIRGLSLEDF